MTRIAGPRFRQIASSDSNWPGDYHWARCDNSLGMCNSWSQKDGGDQVTNFDQGPIGPNLKSPDLVVEYQFYRFMFVPASGVKII